MGIKEY